MNEMSNKWIGARTIRPDGADKVTGRATYSADNTMPGMIWGKMLRSPHAHARMYRDMDIYGNNGNVWICFLFRVT